MTYDLTSCDMGSNLGTNFLVDILAKLSFFLSLPFLLPLFIRPVRCGVCNGLEDDRRPLALWAGHPRNDHKAILGVARPQGIEGSGKAGPSNPWTPLVIWACSLLSSSLISDR
jgi:hypothetical protein